MASEAGFVLLLFYLQCTVLLVVELSLFDAQLLLFSLSTICTPIEVVGVGQPPKWIKKEHFSFLPFRRLIDILWQAPIVFKTFKTGLHIIHGSMKVKPNEPTITVTVNTCQKYALKLASIGYFSAQRSTYNKKRTINNEEGFLEGVAQIWNLTVTSFIEIHGMSLLNSEGNWKLAFNLKFDYYLWWAQ